ncbi:uncharacterized protein LOC143439617 isoform X1 [Arvicanthis niloticus]|uniref:uncharacterized protein LOC117699714 isoform X1 n=2 Tax=Arvicanthis niloticus TaxID=61156 RepID=UPI00402B1D1D
MKKFFGNGNRRHSFSASPTSQRESFLGSDGQCWDAIALHSFKKLKSYKAFGKIHKAASRGAVATIQSRLMLGKNGVNDRDRNGRTMLHYACAHGHPVVVDLLIQWNCDIDLRDSENCTALIKTSQYGNGECASILLDHGAYPNTKDNHGNTALHYTVWYNNTSMADILLEHHADISIRNKDNFTPYTLARLRNNESLAKFLVDKRDQILKADELKRLKLGNLKIKVQPEPPTEDSEQPQVMLDGTSLVTEEADKQKVIGLQSAENLNDSWLHSSEDQFQSVVHASENENHSAIRVSENLNPNLANTSANKSQTEVPENLMDNVVQEAEKTNQSAAALGLQKNDGQTEEQPVPVEENQEDDGLKRDNPNIKVESELPTEDSEQLQVILDGPSLDSFTPLILARMKNNDNRVKCLEDQTGKIKELDELDRSSKKTSNGKKKVKEEGNHMFDLNKLLSSSEGKVEACEIGSYDTILHLIEHLMRQNKDSDSLVKIRRAVCSHKISMELQKQNIERLKGIKKSLKNEIPALEKERFQMEIKKTNLQTELHAMRLTAEKLKAEIMLQKKKNEQLSRVPSEILIEEQVKLNQSLTQSLAEAKRHNRELKKEIHNRLENWRTMMDKDSDAHKNRDFSHKFSSTTHREEDMVLKLREELATLETKIGQEEFQRQCLEDENNLLQQKLKDGKYQQKKCEIVEGRIKQLEEKILSLKTQMDNNMVERSEVEKLKKAIEGQHRSQLLEKINQVNQFLQEDAASNQQTEQEKQNYILLLEDELKNIESELVEVRSRTISLNREMRLYKNKYRAELKTGESADISILEDLEKENDPTQLE